MKNFDIMGVHCLKRGLGQKKRRVKFLTDGGEEEVVIPQCTLWGK